MNRKFINRKNELIFLKRKYLTPGRQFIAVYGRRRTGKTELLLEFARNRPHIYFLADKRGTSANCKRFASAAAAHFKDLPPEISGFDDIFEYIVKRSGKKEKLIIIIDEFSYLVEKDPSIPSVFQLIWDKILKSSNVFLVLCGSSMSMMYKGVLSYKSPLYGRRTGDWELLPFKFRETAEFFREKSIERIIEIYSIAGCIPAYLKEFSTKNSLWVNIKENILKKGQVLFREPEILLREELREPATYFSILEAMTKSAKLSEIASYAGLAAKDLPKYFEVLQDQLKIVKKKMPITEKKSKKTLYFIDDWFLKFWFTFIFPNLSLLEERRIDEVLKIIKKRFNEHVSFAFEDVAREAAGVVFKNYKIGSYWAAFRDELGDRKIAEIDIAGISSDGKELFLGECKWSKKVDAVKLLNNLKNKAASIPELQRYKIKNYLLFAKSFKNDAKGALQFNLKKIAGILKIKK